MISIRKVANGFLVGPGGYSADVRPDGDMHVFEDFGRLVAHLRKELGVEPPPPLTPLPTLKPPPAVVKRPEPLPSGFGPFVSPPPPPWVGDLHPRYPT
jgi:hypothetical protein